MGRRYRRNSPPSPWLMLGGVVVAGGVAWYLYATSKPKAATAPGAGGGGSTPAPTPAVVPPAGPYLIGKDGLSTIIPGGTTASVPAGSPCAAVQAKVKAARAAADIPAFSKTVAEWNAQCPKYTLGV